MKHSFFDGHADTLLENFVRSGRCLTKDTGHVNLTSMEKTERYAQFFAFCPVCFGLREPAPDALFEKALAAFHRQKKEYADTIVLCGNVQQRDAAWEQGKTAALLAIEGAEAINCDPGRLEEACRCGVRMVSLTWNYENALGGSHVSGGGLTAQGREFVRRAQKLGIIVDVSHGSDALFYDVCEIAEKPIVASHSNCRTICGHSRNLTDDQLRCLQQLGGTAGLNFYPPFLRGEKAGFADIRRHLEHMVEVAGEDVPALGSDMDGITSVPEGFSGLEDYEKILSYLADGSFSPMLPEKLCVGNLQHVMDRCGLHPV